MTVQRNAPSTGPPDAAIGTARPSQRLGQAGSSAAPAQAVKSTSGLIPAVPWQPVSGAASLPAAPGRRPLPGVSPPRLPSESPCGKVRVRTSLPSHWQLELCRHSGGCGAASRLLRLCLPPLVPYKLRLYTPQCHGRRAPQLLVHCRIDAAAVQVELPFQLSPNH